MRELKFRAWDKQFKVWVNPKIVDLWAMYVLDNPSSVTHEIMQFTGLKSVNNRDIYEGDILTAMHVGSHIYCGTVVFDKGSFCLKITQAKSNCKDYDVGSTPELNNFEKIKIIGNIYENPELLKGD